MNSGRFQMCDYSYFGIQMSFFICSLVINQLKIRQLRNSNNLSDTL